VKPLRLAAALALVAPFAWAQENPVARERILSAPDCAGPQNIIAEFAREPVNVTHMRVQHIGDLGTDEVRGAVDNEVTWDVGIMTGLHTTPWAQRGYRDAPPPVAASAFQLACGDAGFFLNSYEFSHSLPLFGEGPSAGIGRSLDPAPFAFEDEDSRLAMQARIAVATSYSPNLVPEVGVTAVSFYYYLVDRTTGTYLGHVIGVHDNRPAGVGGSGNEILDNDGFVPFAASPLAAVDGDGRPVRFVEVGPGSGTMTYASTWSEPRFFRAELTYDRFKALLEALKPQKPGISTDPLDYQIPFFGVLAEIFVGTQRGHDVWLGGSVRELTLSRVKKERRLGLFR
jgi:hypothetical protein